MSGRRRKQQAGEADAPPASASSAASEQQRPKRAKAQIIDMDEEALAGEKLSKQLQADAEARAYWEQFSSPLLCAWERDFKDSTLQADSFTKRDHVVAELVSRARPHPPAGAELEQFLAAFSRVHGMDWALVQSLGMQLHASATPAASTSPPAPFPKISSLQQEEGAAPYPDDDDQKEQSPPIGSPATQLGTPLPRHPPQQAPARDMAPDNRSYAGSVHTDPNGTLFALLGELVKRSTPPNSSPDASSSSASAGQSTSNTDLLSKEDKALVASASWYKGVASFASSATVSHDTALQQQSGVLGAFNQQPASEAVIRLIREGKLTEVGAAIPRQQSERQRSAADADERWPDVTVEGLLEALVCTIGPALSDRPQALQDWFALIRATLEVHKRTHSWAAAQNVFMRGSLVAAAASGSALPFRQADTNVLSTAMLHAAQQPRGAAAQPGSGRSGAAAYACKDFSSAKGCSRGDACKYSHMCSVCNTVHKGAAGTAMKKCADASGSGAGAAARARGNKAKGAGAPPSGGGGAGASA